MTRWLRVSALWIGATAAAGSVAFLGVALALRQEAPASTAAARLQDARKVEAFAADLRALLDAIGPTASGAPANAPRLAELRPKIREKHQQILRAQLSGPSYNALLTAADRLAACAASPRNAKLYSAARMAQSELDARVHSELSLLEKRRRPANAVRSPSP